MAEKIFIADKQTLGIPNPTVAGTDSVMNYLKRIDDSLKTTSLVTSAPTISNHKANVHLDVTGSGYLISLNRGTAASGDWSLQIDGGPIYDIRINASGLPLFPIRFANSLKLSCATAPAVADFCTVILD